MTETQVKPIIGADGFPIDPLTIYAEQHIALSPLIASVVKHSYSYNIKVHTYPEFVAISEQSNRFQIQTIFAIFERLKWLIKVYSLPTYHGAHIRISLIGLSEILKAIFRQKISCTEVDLLDIIRWCVVEYNDKLNVCERFSYSPDPDIPITEYSYKINILETFGFILPMPGILCWTKSYLKSNIHSRSLRDAIRTLGDLKLTVTDRATLNRILVSHAMQPHFKTIFNFGIGEIWADTVVEQMEVLAAEKQEAWSKIFIHASDSEKATPSAQWLKTASPLLTEVGIEEFKTYVCHLFSLVEKSAVREIPLYQEVIGDRNKSILTGLIWFCSLIQDNDLLRSIADLTVQCYKKIPGIGVLCLKAGNAGLWLLSEAGTPMAIDCIEKLRQKVKHKSVQKQIEKAFDRAATKAGLSRQDLEELAIPTYSLGADGKLEQILGSFTAKLSIIGDRQVELAWFKADGKPQKSIPAEVKQNFAAELKALKRTADDIKKTLTTQRDRLESFYITTPRTWSFDVWRDRYLHHPVMAHLTRLLVWNFTGDSEQLGIWHNGQLVDADGNPLKNLSESSQVRLWHPIESTPETVLAWRIWLENHAVTQPFKQAHREVYLFTDAERITNTYSNRFAAHIIRQHQFAKLCQQRGWSYALMGDFDGDYEIPNWKLPQWNLQAQFWVEIASAELSESSIFLYLSTDRVCFYNLATGEPIELATIPALIFSEVMRNVDLFVGVCSISNDPNWQDRGEANLYQDYWHNNSFGELGTTAKLRREFLSRLLPKLKISDRCTLDDKFLTVRGDLKTYQIHLGSGNILIQPGSRYLCIVSGVATTKERVFLPFEGDGMLSIILSKAMLLANDRSIKDPTILNQIQH